MATARKLPSGSWRVRVFSHTDSSGKKIYRSFTAPTKDQAELMASQYSVNEKKIRNDLTMGEAMDLYIKHRTGVLSPNTIKDYNCTRSQHVQSLMSIPLYRITSEDIQKAINLEAVSCSPKTVRNINGLITATLRTFRPGFTPAISLPQKEHVDYNIPVDDEIQRLIDDVRGKEMELPIMLAAFGPMRRGEICALRAENIDGNIVHVCENMVQDGPGKWIVRHPKSYAGDRYIDFPDFVAELWKGKHGRIVEMTPTAITRRFQRITHRLSLQFRFHDLRHYSASIQHAMGVPDAYIMQRGGWSSDGVLKQIYRHALDDKTREMSQKVNGYFESMTRNMTQKRKTPVNTEV